jgi:hypothetical protein
MMVRSRNLTYEFDVAPHLRRALAIRAQRNERWYRLHQHDGRSVFWLAAIPGCIMFWALAVYCIQAL